MMETVKYALGEQDFQSLREMNFLYIDKTRYVEKILDGGKYVFLARPLRFGKSLFLSTLQYYFEGRRELFKGLYIDSRDKDWTPHPVLRLDLNTERFAETDMLETVLETLFAEWEKKYNVDNISSSISQRFKTIIKAAYEQTGLFQI